MNEEYENRVVCFLDILGFKKYVEESVSDNSKLKTILNVINILNKYKSDKENDTGIVHDSIIVSQFSDSIVISFLITEKDQLVLALYDLQEMIFELLELDVLLRGGIAYGKLIHTNKILFGPALHEAYNLESKIAIYPRIIISKRLINEYLKQNNEEFSRNFESNHIENLLIKCDDGYFFIDYFSSIEQLLDNKQYYDRYLNNLINIITEGLNSNSENIRIKYQWMQEKYNLLINGECKTNCVNINAIDSLEPPSLHNKPYFR